MMGVGLSVLLFAVGAILTWGVSGLTGGMTGTQLHTAGVVLMVVGTVGMLLSLLFWSSVAPFRRGRPGSPPRPSGLI